MFLLCNLVGYGHFTCIEGPEICLHTVFQKSAKRLNVSFGSMPFCKKVLNDVMNNLGPWQGPPFWTKPHIFFWKKKRKPKPKKIVTMYIHAFLRFLKNFTFGNLMSQLGYLLYIVSYNDGLKLETSK